MSIPLVVIMVLRQVLFPRMLGLITLLLDRGADITRSGLITLATRGVNRLHILLDRGADVNLTGGAVFLCVAHYLYQGADVTRSGLSPQQRWGEES